MKWSHVPFRCLIVCQSFPSVGKANQMHYAVKTCNCYSLESTRISSLSFHISETVPCTICVSNRMPKPPPFFVTPETCNSSLTLATAIFIKKLDHRLVILHLRNRPMYHLRCLIVCQSFPSLVTPIICNSLAIPAVSTFIKKPRLPACNFYISETVPCTI